MVGLVWCGVVKGRSQKRKIATNSWNVVVVVLRVCVCRGEVRGLGWVARWGGRVRERLVAAPNAKNATCSRGAVGRVGGSIVTLLTQKTPSALNHTHGAYRAVEGEGGAIDFYVHSGVEPDKDPNVVHRCAPPYHRRGAGSFAGVQVRSSRHADPPFTLSPESNLTQPAAGQAGSFTVF